LLLVGCDFAQADDPIPYFYNISACNSSPNDQLQSKIICNGENDEVDFRNEFNNLIAQGKPFVFRMAPGNYSFGNQDGYCTEFDLSGFDNPISIEAEGAIITYSGSSVNSVLYFKDMGHDGLWYPKAHLSIQGLQLFGNEDAQTGIYLRNMPYTILNHILVTGFAHGNNHFGIYITDIVGQCTELVTIQDSYLYDNTICVAVMGVNGGAAAFSIENTTLSIIGVDNPNSICLWLSGQNVARSKLTRVDFHLGGADGQIGWYIDTNINGFVADAIGFDNHSQQNSVLGIVTGERASGIAYIDGLQYATSGGELTITNFSQGSLTAIIRSSE
jgi:hypothetical protein